MTEKRPTERPPGPERVARGPTEAELPTQITPRIQHIFQGTAEEARAWAGPILASPDSPPAQRIDAAATVLKFWREAEGNRRIPLDDQSHIPEQIGRLFDLLYGHVAGDQPQLAVYAGEALCDAADQCVGEGTVGDYTMVAPLMAETMTVGDDTKPIPPMVRADATATTLKIFRSLERQGTRYGDWNAPGELKAAKATLQALKNHGTPEVRLHVAGLIETRMQDPRMLQYDAWGAGPQYQDYREACLTGLLRMAAGITEVDDPVERWDIVNMVAQLAKNQALKGDEQEKGRRARQALVPLLGMSETMSQIPDGKEQPIGQCVVNELLTQLTTYHPYMSEQRPGTDAMIEDIHRILGDAVDGDVEVAGAVLRKFRPNKMMNPGFMTNQFQGETSTLADTPAGQHCLDLIARSGRHPELRAASVDAFRWMLGVGNETPEIAESLGNETSYGEQRHPPGISPHQTEQAGVIADALARVATRGEMEATVGELEKKKTFGAGQDPIVDEVRKRVQSTPSGPQIKPSGEDPDGIDVSGLF